jgi:hypothetical protein
VNVFTDAKTDIPWTVSITTDVAPSVNGVKAGFVTLFMENVFSS